MDLTYDRVMADLEALPSHAPAVRNALVYFAKGNLTTGETAKILGVSENTVKNWVRLGRFPSARQTHGGHWRFRADEVFKVRDASMAARRVNASGMAPALPDTDADPYDGVPLA